MPMTFSQRFRKPVVLIRLILSFVLLFAPALPARQLEALLAENGGCFAR